MVYIIYIYIAKSDQAAFVQQDNADPCGRWVRSRMRPSECTNAANIWRGQTRSVCVSVCFDRMRQSPMLSIHTERLGVCACRFVIDWPHFWPPPSTTPPYHHPAGIFQTHKHIFVCIFYSRTSVSNTQCCIAWFEYIVIISPSCLQHYHMHSAYVFDWSAYGWFFCVCVPWPACCAR